jgi:ADP-ribose pyrophosphatase
MAKAADHMAVKTKRSKHVRILRSKQIYKGRVFELRTDTILEPNGVRATRDIVVHPGSVVVLPVLSKDQVLLIRQYRYAAGDYLWELVAGHREPGESPEAGAHRELLEETGCTARRLRKLLEFFPSPGLLSERMWVYAAEGLTRGKAQPEEDERITTRAFTWKRVDAMIRSGRLHDGKSVAGLLYYMRYIAKL